MNFHDMKIKMHHGTKSQMISLLEKEAAISDKALAANVIMFDGVVIVNAK